MLRLSFYFEKRYFYSQTGFNAINSKCSGEKANRIQENIRMHYESK